MAPLVSVSTVVQPHEDATKVVDSVKAVFPDWVPDRIPENAAFPNERGGVLITGSAESLDTLLESARNQRILDTALDAMTMELEGDSTGFALSRQAALDWSAVSGEHLWLEPHARAHMSH